MVAPARRRPRASASSAARALIARRLDHREPDSWPGKSELISRARALADLVPAMPGINLTIDSGHRDTESIAAEIVQALAARGLIGTA